MNEERDVLGEVPDLADMARDVGIVRSRGDGERVPLPRRDLWNVHEEPLPRLVLERRLVEPDLHRTRGVHEDADDLGLAAGADFAVDALEEVGDAAPDRPAGKTWLERTGGEGREDVLPGFVAEAADGFAGESTANEAAGWRDVSGGLRERNGDVLA